MKVLFVCLGNICRSPLAEALFVHKIRTRDVADLFEVDSCGTSNYNVGDGPDHRTLNNALRNGVEVNHVARQLTVEDVGYYDRILVMDSKNHEHVLSMVEPAHHAKVVMMRYFDPEGAGNVPDPYWGKEEDFQEVFEILDRSVSRLVDQLLEEKRR
jgi:protein-tyrosine phosphatase